MSNLPTAFDPIDRLTPDFFAIAQSKIYGVYFEQRFVKPAWYVVHVVVSPDQLIRSPKANPLVCKSTDPDIKSRFRHPSGRLYYYEEAVQVINELNHRYKISRLAATQQVGGMSKFVHRVAIATLGIETTTVEE